MVTVSASPKSCKLKIMYSNLQFDTYIFLRFLYFILENRVSQTIKFFIFVHNFQMDNLGYQGELEKGTELEVVQLRGKMIAVSPSNGTTISSQATASCASEVCRTARQRRAIGVGPDPPEDGPWNRKKTIFLIGLLVLLLVWIVVYATLSEMKKL